MNPKSPIGIFDSGVGGLTVAKEIKRILPNESIVYFGDTQHLPYGDKSPETIKEYSRNITQFLLDQNCKTIVIACNTASANALSEVQEMANNKALVFDVISPVAEKVAYQLHQSVGVIATQSTVNSKIYSKSIKKHNKHIKVNELATPLLVPIIEQNLILTPISKSTIDHYLSHKKLKNIDTLILGCTHYPIIHKEISQYYNRPIDIVDSPGIVANYVKHKLEKENLLNNGPATYHFYVSDFTKGFDKMAKKFFGKDINLEVKSLA